VKPCDVCHGTGWQQTSSDRIMEGMREGCACTRCLGTCVVPDTPAEIAKANRKRVYQMHAISGTKGTRRAPTRSTVAT
jgi:hypothetical protein